MSLLGRAGRAADDASATDAARVQAWQDGVELGIVAPNPIHEGEASVCAPCAATVPGVLPGAPCPACGSPVQESPRIITPFRSAAAGTGIRRAI